MDFEDYLQNMEHLSLAPSVRGTNKTANTKFQDISEETEKFIAEQLGAFSIPAETPGFGRGQSPGFQLPDPTNPQDTGFHPQDPGFHPQDRRTGSSYHSSPSLHPGVIAQEEITPAPPAWLVRGRLSPVRPLDPVAVTRPPYLRSQDSQEIIAPRSLISQPPETTGADAGTRGELRPSGEREVSRPPPASCAGPPLLTWDPAMNGPNFLQRNEYDGAVPLPEDMDME